MAHFVSALHQRHCGSRWSCCAFHDMTMSQSNPDFLNNPLLPVSARLHTIWRRERQPWCVCRECAEAHGKVSQRTGRGAFWDCLLHSFLTGLSCFSIVLFCVCCSALGVPATDYVMDGRFPVRKLGGLSLPLESPALETLRLLRRHGYPPKTSQHQLRMKPQSSIINPLSSAASLTLTWRRGWTLWLTAVAQDTVPW